jgi:hypothetical protein
MDSNSTFRCISTPVWPEKYTEVVIPTIDVGGPMSWCQQHCIGEFDARLAKYKGSRVWLFELPEDATAFSLIWK